MKIYSSILFIASLLIFLSCDCQNVDCISEDTTSLEVRFQKDGVDAFFSDAPILDIESLVILTSMGTTVPFSTFDNRISIELVDDEVYTFQLGALQSVNLTGRLQLVDDSDCCDVFRANEIKVDDQPICNIDCETIVINLE